MPMKLQGLIDAALPIVCVLAMVAGCCRQAVRHEGPPPASRPWCAAWLASTPEGNVAGEACVAERTVCERAVSRARRWGSLGGLRSVGDCFYREGTR
jgi:hypothetical protein